MSNNESISNMSSYLSDILRNDLKDNSVQNEIFDFFKYKIVKEVDDFFNNDWDEVKKELLDYYEKKPVNTYKAIRRLLMFFTYRFNIEAGEEDERLNDLFNKFKDEEKNIKEGIKELLTDDNIFNKGMGFIREEVMLKTRSNSYNELQYNNLEEFIKDYETKINFNKIKDAWLLNNEELIKSSELSDYITEVDGVKYIDIEKIINKIKPVFEFIKNKKEEIINKLPEYNHDGSRRHDRGIIEFTNERVINLLTTLLINRKITNKMEINNLEKELEKMLEDKEMNITKDNILKIVNKAIKELKEDIDKLSGIPKQTSNKYKKMLRMKKEKLRKYELFKKDRYPESSTEYGKVNFYLELGNMIELLKKPSPEEELENLIKKGENELRKKGFDDELINHLMREGVSYLKNKISGNNESITQREFSEDELKEIELEEALMRELEEIDEDNLSLYNELFPNNELLGKRISVKEKISSKDYNKTQLEEIINSIINESAFSDVKEYDYYKNLESRLQERDWEFTPDELIDLATIKEIRNILSIYDEEIVEDALKKISHLPAIKAPIINELRTFIKTYKKETKKKKKEEINIKTFLISPEAFIKEDYEKAYIILARIKKMLDENKKADNKLTFIKDYKEEVLIPNALLSNDEKETIQLIMHYNKNKGLEKYNDNNKDLKTLIKEAFTYDNITKWIKSIKNDELTMITTKVNNEIEEVIKENNPYLNYEALSKAKQRLVTLVNEAIEEDDKANLMRIISNYVKGLRNKAIIIEETSKFLSKKGVEINKKELSNEIINKNMNETYNIIRNKIENESEDEINKFIKRIQSKEVKLKKYFNKTIDKIMRNIKPEEIDLELLKKLVIIENPINKINNELEEIINNNKILTPTSFKELIKKDNIEIKDYNAIINYLKLKKAEPQDITLNPNEIKKLIINGDRIITDEEARGFKQLIQH